MTMTDTKTILRAVKRLPTISKSFSEMSALIGDESASMRDFERVLKPDPVLTAGVLRLANSACFGISREVTSIGHALMLLGSKRLFDLSASMALAGVLPKYIAGYEMTTQAFWTHCVAVAVLSEQLVAEFDIPLNDSPFTAGLLHDIGKLVIGVFLAEHAQEVLERVRANEHTLVKVETELLGVDHCEVGATLANRWKLPESIVNVIRWHHAPEDSPGDHTIVDVVHAADALAHAVGYGADVGELTRVVQPGVSDRLGLTRPRLEIVIAESTVQIRELEQMLDQTNNSKGSN